MRNPIWPLFVLTLLSLTGVAQDPPAWTCHWVHCTVVKEAGQPGMSVCTRPANGSLGAMLMGEKDPRGRGHIFLRECVNLNESTALDWAAKQGFFLQD